MPDPLPSPPSRRRWYQRLRRRISPLPSSEGAQPHRFNMRRFLSRLERTRDPDCTPPNSPSRHSSPTAPKPSEIDHALLPSRPRLLLLDYEYPVVPGQQPCPDEPIETWYAALARYERDTGTALSISCTRATDVLSRVDHKEAYLERFGAGSATRMMDILVTIVQAVSCLSEMVDNTEISVRSTTSNAYRDSHRFRRLICVQ
ncbi:uncharacterized protein SCHCODRAFT_02106268 [Schizophyllum commune H4-8]|uniref:uncharacterized protein n=1 Tax=Schizophyllum commune (strain H4-8 / FGSC 9210) TaxID=578458 RepID=UPI00215EC2A2|nr:uncharacterized protein SCHCODRAFT_02106268 [Schizophyllum commune H4-8]KAI5885807.1 hypothetical protein SCHCODRAFT_02106268 [Schizophyllum commune H4-8]